MNKKMVISHLRDDKKMFKKEASEDKKLIKDLSKKRRMRKRIVRSKRKSSLKKSEKDKMKKVMHEFKERTLHSGSKQGPIVRKPSQALAIAFSEAARLKKRKK